MRDLKSIVPRIFILIGAALLFGTGVAAYARMAVHGDGSDSRDGLFSMRRENAADGGDETVYEAEPIGADTYTVLFCGVDNTNALADVIIVAKLDLTHHSVDLLQIPRDLYVGESYKTGKINEACRPLSHKNPLGRIRAIIEEQLRIPIDGTVAVTLDTVRAVVDAAGGVEIDLPQTIDYLPGKTLYPGKQVLDGEHAEWFLRFRQGYENADLGRLEAQRLFLSAGMKTAKKLGKVQLLALAAKFYDQVSTDIPLGKAYTLLTEAMQVREENITMKTVPVSGAVYGPYSVVVTNRNQLAPIVNELFREDDPIGIWDLRLCYPPEPESEEPEPEPDQNLWNDFAWDYEDDGFDGISGLVVGE